MITSIIGAGAIGGYLAQKVDGEVHIFEEHKKVGLPVQCSGILTHNLKDFVKLDDKFVLNKADTIKLVSPNGTFCEFKLKKPDVIIDRAKFDGYLVDKAVDKGAVLHKGFKFVDTRGAKIRFENGKTFDTDLVVGADGPLSRVRKTFFGGDLKKFIVGKQVRAKLKKPENIVEVHFNVPGFFSWVIPEGDGVFRIATGSIRGVDTYLSNFLKSLNVGKVIETQGGIIPVYDKEIRLWNRKNAFLVGDSAGMVKALSGGGIIPGLRSAEILSQCINSGKYGKYDLRFKKEVGANLEINLEIRKFLDKFDSKDYDKLIKLMKEHHFKGFDRDNISFKDISFFIKPKFSLLYLKKALLNL